MMVGWALGGAVFAQGVILVIMGGLEPGAALQLLVVAGALSLLTEEAWRHRMLLNHRIDMLLVMGAFGGLGMLLGWWIDLAGTAGGGLHAAHGHARSIWDSVFSWMTAGMFIGAVPASLRLTRCAELARKGRRRWISTHILGNAAMLFLMIAGGRTLGPAIASLTGSRVVGMHVGMLIGMLVGMHAGMFAGEALLGLKPWREWTWESEERSKLDPSASPDPAHPFESDSIRGRM